MNFGYFDDEKREYVITRPDTPAPWANYLGSPDLAKLYPPALFEISAPYSGDPR